MEYPARVLITGSFPEEAIEMVHEDAPALSPEVTAKVNELWGAELKQNPHLFSGPMLVARALSRPPGRIRLHCMVSEYKNFMGTTHEDVAPMLPDGQLHRAIGFLAATITSDGYVMLGVRSPKIDWPTLRHVVPAGRLTPAQEHPYKGIRDEFQSELGIGAADIVSLECIGIVADMTWRRLNYEFVFFAQTRLTFRQVIERAKTARSGTEHVQLEPFPASADFMNDLLMSDPDGWVPTGFAGLALCGYNRFDIKSFPWWIPAHRTYAEHMGRRLL
ncbi:MAG: hypothetical protein AAB916_00100 [Patescibacteria group bacterium]